ncbi:MAG TPA: hypothetical protein VNO33_02155 [Kofleriaceae bacterium]|nr:hypothetical protein [Kofleriaceae bacterium]
MNQQAMLEELEAVASKLAVKVSYEALASSVGSGGLCRVHGQYRVIIDKRAQVGERLAALAQALGQLPMLTTSLQANQTGEVELSGPVRDLLRHYNALRRAS